MHCVTGDGKNVVLEMLCWCDQGWRECCVSETGDENGKDALLM